MASSPTAWCPTARVAAVGTSSTRRASGARASRPCRSAIIRHALYLAIAKTYSPRSMFYVADYRDTFFQADPFVRVVERRGRRSRAWSSSSSRALLVTVWKSQGFERRSFFTSTSIDARERHRRGVISMKPKLIRRRPFKKIGNCPFNGGWVRNCWGRAEWDRLRNQSVLCSGSYMGAQPAIVNFETRLLNEVDAHDCHHKGVPSDQGYLNYLFYTGICRPRPSSRRAATASSTRWEPRRLAAEARRLPRRRTSTLGNIGRFATPKVVFEDDMRRGRRPSTSGIDLVSNPSIRCRLGSYGHDDASVPHKSSATEKG